MWEKQAEAFQLIERLVNNGKTLPLSPERAEDILKMKEPASTEDLKMLEEAVKKL